MKRLLLLSILLISLHSSIIIVGASAEVDDVAMVYNIVDGDTFDAFPVGRIRLADIDAPESWESGYSEAKDFLHQMIYEKRVYLDVDDIYNDDGNNRIVCLVYVRHNLTHLKNVNEAMLQSGYASVSNYPNEFNPSSWSLYVQCCTCLPEKTYSELLSSYLGLQSSYDTLQDNYNNLQFGYSSLQDIYSNLQSQYDTLQSDYSSLNSTYYQKLEEMAEYGSLLVDLSELENELINLQLDYYQLDNDHKNLSAEYDELTEAHNQNLITYQSLESNYTNLQNEKEALQTEYQSLNSLYGSLANERDIFKYLSVILIAALGVTLYLLMRKTSLH